MRGSTDLEAAVLGTELPLVMIGLTVFRFVIFLLAITGRVARKYGYLNGHLSPVYGCHYTLPVTGSRGCGLNQFGNNATWAGLFIHGGNTYSLIVNNRKLNRATSGFNT
jgi:hypothetical protein